jgi:tRNA A-37 threonylcarbamoyl transferase component Bud32
MTKPFLEINPRYRPILEQHELATAAQLDKLLDAPALIVSGHPDRNVSRLTLGTGASAIPAFLKREHRVPWRDRLANALAGFGFVSRSQREFQMLVRLRDAGIGCPDPIAAGEDGLGRAFLVVRELAGGVDLRVFLHRRQGTSHYHRCRFARRLGEALARIHDAGFDHPDLYAKHVLVDPVSEAIRFLDWQRSRRRSHLPWSRRWQSLAALDATLADDLATVGERLLCLRAYLRASIQVFVPRAFLSEAIRQIRARTRKLQRRRRIREQRRVPLAIGTQNLIWLDGEALMVTREFLEECRGRMPCWLTEPGSWPGPGEEARTSVTSLPGQRRAILVRRRTSRLGTWLWHALRRCRLKSPELEQSTALFRLQRFGVRTPRLLAIGQRHPLPWQTESFLLTEEPPAGVPLRAWLCRQSRRPLWTAERKQQRRLIREAGDLLRRIHDAGYRGRGFTDRLLVVQGGSPSSRAPSLVLGTLEGIDCRRCTSAARARQDLADVRRLFADQTGRADQLRFLLAYLVLPRLTPAAKDLVRAVLLYRARGAGVHGAVPRLQSRPTAPPALSLSGEAAP